MDLINIEPRQFSENLKKALEIAGKLFTREQWPRVAAVALARGNKTVLAVLAAHFEQQALVKDDLLLALKLYAHAGHSDNGFRLFRSLSRETGAPAEAYVYLGICHVLVGDFSAAVDAFAAAIRMSPSMGIAYIYRAAVARAARAGSAGPYVPTPFEVVERACGLANVQPGDVVLDVGCGDGRILHRVARLGAARAIGYEINRDLVKIARTRAAIVGLQEQIEIREGNVYETELPAFDVAFLYLTPHAVQRLAPKLLRAARRGGRIVLHDYQIEGWPVSQEVLIQSSEKIKTAGWSGARLTLYELSWITGGVTPPSSFAATL